MEIAKPAFVDTLATHSNQQALAEHHLGSLVFFWQTYAPWVLRDC